MQGRNHEIWSGPVAVGGNAAEGSGIEARSADYFACSADYFAQSTEKIFAFIFELSGWALVAPSCFKD